MDIERNDADSVVLFWLLALPVSIFITTHTTSLTAENFLDG